MRMLRPSLLTGLWLLLSAPLLQAAPVYEVELLLFTWQGSAATSRPVTESRIGALGGGLPGIEFEALPKSQLKLEPENYTLAHSGGKATPILHLGWRQQVPPHDYPRAVPFRSDDNAVAGHPRVEGVAAVSIGRTIHLDLDMLLREPAWQNRTTGPGLAQVGAAYRLQAHRRIKPGELTYIDHDRMGVLLTINRIGGNDEPTSGEGTPEGDAPRADPEALSRQPAGR